MGLERPTFEYVKTCQKKLKFEFFEQLISSNDVIAKESREEFFDCLSGSLLGLEKNYPFLLGEELDVHANHNLGDLGSWLKKALDWTDSVDKKQPIHFLGKNIRVSNSLLWRALMRSCYPVMSDSLQCALKSSAEIQNREGSSYGIKTKEKIKQE
jgi:hypothetical protein